MTGHSVFVTDAEASTVAEMRQRHMEKLQTDHRLRVAINVGGTGSVTSDGVVQVSRKGAAVMTSIPDRDFVQINGMTVKRAVYENLRASGELPPNAKVHDPFQ